MTQEITTFGYHFLDEEMRASRGYEPAWSVGERRDLPDYRAIVPCEFGYHASPTPLQASLYARGPMLTLVQLYGDIYYEHDKLAARSRRLIAVTDTRAVNKEWVRSLIEMTVNAKPMPECFRAAEALLRRGQPISQELRDAVRTAGAGAISGTRRSFLWNVVLYPDDVRDAIGDFNYSNPSNRIASNLYNKLCYEALVAAQKASIAAQPAVV